MADSTFEQDASAFDPSLFVDASYTGFAEPSAADGLAMLEQSPDDAMAASFLQDLSRSAMATLPQASASDLYLPPHPGYDLFGTDSAPAPAASAETEAYAPFADSLDEMMPEVAAAAIGDYQFAMTGSTEPFQLPQTNPWGSVDAGQGGAGWEVGGMEVEDADTLSRKSSRSTCGSRNVQLVV